MKKKYINFVVLFLSIALGFVIVSFYNISRNVMGDDVVSDKKINLLREELEKVGVEKRELNDKISTLREEVRNFESLSEKNEASLNELTSELNNYKIFSGAFNVNGPGIIITINEPSGEGNGEYYEESNIAYNYYYILSIVSYLNSAGAEAISINDQRFTSYTEVVPVGNFLNVNGKQVVAPIEIKAIGDKRTLNSAVHFVGGVLEQMQYLGFGIEVIENDEIIINKLVKEKEFKYAVPYDAEENE